MIPVQQKLVTKLVALRPQASESPLRLGAPWTPKAPLRSPKWEAEIRQHVRKKNEEKREKDYPAGSGKHLA